MLRLSGSIHFPSLLRVGETQFKSWQETGMSTTLYRLDWSRLDSEREQHWVKKLSERHTSDQTFILADYPGSLPEPYDLWVKSLIFSIPSRYLDEIRRVSRMAAIEWATERHFDTMIRDICLSPAIAYVYVGFRLLADCLYDAKTNYFYRGENKIIAPQALLYKFWAGQTGRGCVRDHAAFRKIQGSVCSCKGDQGCSTCHAVREFLKAIDEYEERLEKDFPPTVVSGSDSTNMIAGNDSGFIIGDSTGLFTERGTSTISTSAQPALIVDGSVVINGDLKVNQCPPPPPGPNPTLIKEGYIPPRPRE